MIGRGGQTFCMKGRIGKNFEAEGHTALEEKSNKGHHQWRTLGFGKGGRGTPPGACPQPLETKGVWGRSPQPPTNFYDFLIKNTYFISVL